MDIGNSLIQACVDQDRKAQKQLYELLLPYLKATTNRYLRDTSYSKDVLQESFIKIFRSIHQHDPNRAPIKYWAAKIVVNTCFNYNKRVIGTPTDEFVIGIHEKVELPTAIENLSNEYLLSLLKKMPGNYFEVFNLYVIDGYSHKEIAEILKIKESSSRARLTRARKWLNKTFSSRSRISLLSVLSLYNIS